MEIRFTEHRELLPGVDGRPEFWHRSVVGWFEHRGEQMVVTASVRDEELTPERRALVERLLTMEAHWLVSGALH